ncbi:DUF3592 domain-containing protein [Streptomyces sp. NPDC093094]|uniref:DUF3592 domain-containing protein n=1 Tax=Streptomyces sp. NPDC093094 TaxID=3366026 RepID=UPI0038165FFE
MDALIGVGLFLLPFGLRILHVERSMRRHAVRVTAVCVDHIHEGYTADPRRMVCVHTTADGREMRWVVSAAPDFPGIGDPVPLVYDARNPGLAQRQPPGPGWVTWGTGWSLLAASLLTAGLLSRFVL